MKRILAASLLILSASAYSLELENPSSMKWGGRFTHFACESFSSTTTSAPSAMEEFNVTINEFGINREMKYGNFNAFYGPDKNCEYRVQFLRHKETQTLEFVQSEATDSAECLEGREALDAIFTSGMSYSETGRGHRYFSFKFLKGLENTCQNVEDLSMEFVRIR